MTNQPLEEDAKKAVEQLGLSESNYTVIEGVGQGCPAGPIYRPQADISNLFLPIVEATLNHPPRSIPTHRRPAGRSTAAGLA